MALYGISIFIGILISGLYCCDIPDDFVGARAHGDIIIGGLFAIHGRMMNSVRGYPHQPAIQNCAGFEMQGFLQMLAMAHAIELINNSSLIPGIKLGYEIYDTCSESTLAISATLRFLSTYNTSGDNVAFKCNYSDYTPKVKAVIGGSYSEVSIAVARLLNTQLIPQVSHASSAQILSDKFRFPAFLRTIPNDAYQTKAMAKLIQSSGWNWIGLITMDDDYGRSALESFGNQATNICIAFKEIIPSHLSDSTMQSRIDKAIQTILKETRVNVIVAFLKPSLIIKLFLKAMEKKIKRTWIASDSWSVSTGISSIPDIHKIGKVIGFIFKSGDTTSFQEYVNDLNQKDFEMNRFMDQYAMLVSNCSKKKYSEMYSCVTDSSKEAVVTYTRIKDKSLREDFLSDTVQPGFVFSTQLAVTAIAHAIRNLCLDRNCRNPNAFAPWELLQSLKAVNFTYKGRTLYFDSKGDASTGYDVLLWKTGPNGKINITPFAEYDTQKDVFKFSTKDKENEFKLLRKIFSRCSDECKPGQMKKTSDNKSQHTCCYECVPCPENHYTDNSDMGNCLECNNKTHWSPVNSPVCYMKQIAFLRWDDGFAIVLLVASFVGIVLIVAIGMLFTKNFNTPVVKASGGFLCYVILLSLLFSFISAVFFIGQPEDIKCKMRQTMFGISFTLAVACHILKLIKILLAFTFEPKVQSILKRLYKPFTLVFVCTGIQVMICTTWLVFWPPYTKENFSLPKIIILECDEGSTVTFSIMLGYIAVLAFICFLFAFWGRKLPENYNEAKFITFGMLIYFIAWITFIPIYATTFGIYLPAVEMIVILISNYGILSCTFLPKCYIILCKQDTNTKSAFLKMIYKYSSKSASSLTVNQLSSSSLPLPEGSNTVTSVSSRPSVSCISNSFSFHERLVAADIPPTKARCLRRKRLSSI